MKRLERGEGRGHVFTVASSFCLELRGCCGQRVSSAVREGEGS